jgi:hypothetical protein
MIKNLKVFATDEAYYSDNEYASASMIKDIEFCEFFFESKHITKIFVDEEEKDYFIYGSAVDTLLTEAPEIFAKRFMPVKTKIDCGERQITVKLIEALKAEIKEKENTKKAHKTLDDKLIKLQEKLSAIIQLEGITQITETMYKHIKASADELLRQPLFRMFGVGSSGKSQEIITTELDGKLVKGKLDYINVEKKIIADVKTCANIERFDPRMYAEQLAYYRKLASIKYGIPEKEWDCYILAVDKQTDVKRSEIMCLSKNLIDAAWLDISEKLEKYYRTKEFGFYQPITEKPDAEYMDARKTVCYKCPFYNQCDFSLQKEITYIS